MARRPPAGPVLNAPDRVRQRARADGTWRVWWEPRAADRALGFAPVDLDAARPDWTRREAARLNAELDRARAAGARAPRHARGRRIEDLVHRYRASPEWARLSPRTQRSYLQLLGIIGPKWGQAAVADFDKPTMKVWYDTLVTARGLRMAQALIRMMSVLFSQAELIGWRAEQSNPCFRLRLRSPPPRARRGDWAEVDAAIAAAATLGWPGFACAVALSVYQGQRQTDVLAPPRGAFGLLPAADADGARRWVWRFRRSKRGNLGVMPLHDEAIPHVRRLLAETGPAEAPFGPKDPLYVDAVTGLPFTAETFGARWKRVRAAAARACPSIASMQFRDLRRTFGMAAREGGADDDDIGDVLGNSVARSPQLEETYLPPSFATAARAVAAVRRPVKREKAG
jgi:integrase